MARLYVIFLLGSVSVLPVLCGCGRDRTPSGSQTVVCSETTTPYLLESKLDDDDGDGNPYDEDFPAINDEDDDIADHTWIRDHRGVYHLFFHNEGHAGGQEIEHYTSADLKSLEYVGVALRPNPAGWDSHGLWAPHIVRFGDTYYLFYTGVDGVDPGSRQRIGLAVSNDLVTWHRFPGNRCPGTTGDGCIYECDEPWTTWGDSSGDFNHQCRDPFIIYDPLQRCWLLFATAKSTNGYGVVTVASSRNCVDWTGVGFIDATRRLPGGTGAQATGGQAENPHIMTHGGTHYLLFTDWKDGEDTLTVANPRTIVQYATSPSLLADTLGSATWTYRGYTPDPGVNAIEVQRIEGDIWLMSQSIANERSGLWEQRRKLRLMCVLFNGDLTFETSNIELFRDPAAGPFTMVGVTASE